MNVSAVSDLDQVEPRHATLRWVLRWRFCCYHIFPINNFRPESSVFAVHLCRQIGNAQMASHAIAFFAGVGTTFAILTAGFSGGLVFTKAAVEDRRGVNGETPAPRRALGVF